MAHTSVTPEGEILKPKDPGLKSTDEWREIVLENAYAYVDGDPKSLVSVLEACEGYPLRVVGQLDPFTDEEDMELYNLSCPNEFKFYAFRMCRVNHSPASLPIAAGMRPRLLFL